MSKLAFCLKDICFIRQGKSILHNINWEVNYGENWVLLGANGIGKSTLIQILSTQVFPTSGSAQILGNELGKVDVFTLRPKVGVLGADFATNFYNDEKVIDLVALGKTRLLSGWGDSRDKEFLTDENKLLAEEQLKLFDAEKLKDKAWGVLSQGERKRVQMARVLISQPDLLLFDEPTAGLDLAGREIVINTLNRIASNNLKRPESVKKPAIVLVNHHVEEIPPAFDKCALMGRNSADSGIIMSEGSIKEVLTSRNLTNAYGIDLTVSRMANLRYHASASVIIEQS